MTASSTRPKTAWRCPVCYVAVTISDTRCPNCQVNLAIAREAQVLQSASAPLVDEMKLPRFGEFLVQNGDITLDELQAALAHQDRIRLTGPAPSLGVVLLELGFVTRDQLDRASFEQLRQLQEILQRANADLEQRVLQRTAELQRALNQVNQLNQLKSNFVMNVTHELRTPLARVLGYADLLDGQLGDMNVDQLSAVQAIHKAAHELRALVDNLLDFSSIEKGQITIHPDAMELTAIAANLLEQPAVVEARQRLNITGMWPPTVPTVWADADKIRWVISQLIENALKFTPDGGSVTLKLTPNKQSVSISVIDTGIGISEEHLAEIFQPFHQVDGSVTRRYGGTGLGLTLVKHILTAHATTINVVSAPNMGSTFAFDLPLSPT